MNIEKRRLSTILILALFTISFALAHAVPPTMPHQFYGYVMMDGMLAPDGIFVNACIDGITYEYIDTLGGGYGMFSVDLFKVPADDPETTEKDGGVAGDLVDFYVDGFYAATFVFESGQTTWLDLDVSTTLYELQLYEGWNLIGIPFIPDDPSIEVILYDILDYVESVWTYDGETGYWSSFSPFAPSDLMEIRDGKGYWIKMFSDVLWEIDIG